MSKEIVAMILAGGKGTRLEALTKKVAKPAVSFGGRYRIIDFPLSNCANSGITTVGVLMQYESIVLDNYIGSGEKWGLNGVRAVTQTLSPRQTEQGMAWYKGTADAIYENLDFLDSQDPEYVLILSGDHIYGMSYRDMLNKHIERNADVTICSIGVPLEEASRFGIIIKDENDRVVEFQEKPAKPRSNLASMGIYIFTYKVLRKLLIDDAKNENSSHDFGKDILPKMLADKKKLYCYQYKGYWKDVGTIASLHEANMDLIDSGDDSDLAKVINHNLYTEDTNSAPQYIGKEASIKNSIVNQGAVILGSVEHSVISNEVWIEKGAKVINSVLLPGARICKNAVVKDAIVNNNAFIGENVKVLPENGKIELVSGRRME